MRETKFLFKLFIHSVIIAGFTFMTLSARQGLANPIVSDKVVDVNNKDTDPKKNDNYFTNNFINFWEYPGYTGIEGKHTINGQYNTSWNTLPFMGSKNFILAYDVGIKKIKSGIGLYMESNVSGPDRTTKFNLTYSYIFFKNENSSLSLGTLISSNNKAVILSALTWESQYNNTPGKWTGVASGEPVYPNRRYLNLGGGLWFSNKGFFAGLSYFHLLNIKSDGYFHGYNPYPSFLNEYCLNTGYKFHLSNTSFDLCPSIEIKKYDYLYIVEPRFLAEYKERFVGGFSSDFLSSDLKNLRVYAGFSYKKFRLTYAPSYAMKKYEGVSSVRPSNINLRFQF